MKPLELKSPDNALAIGLYAGLVFFAISFLSGSGSKALAALLGGDAPVVLWAWLLLAAALCGGAAAVSAPIRRRPSRSLHLEAVAAPVMGALLLTYVLALSRAPTTAPITEAIFLGVGFAGLARGVQLVFELRTLRQAQRAHTTVTQESLADPRDT